MAVATVNKYCMEMGIRGISKLESIFSQEILIHGIPWYVKVCKEGDRANESLACYLFCANEDKSPNWSFWGTASFKLLPINANENAIEYDTEPYVFDATELGYGTPCLIKWNDLFNQNDKYIKDDTINLEIKVNAENSNDPNRSRMIFERQQKCCDDCYSATFLVTVNNVSDLKAVQSPTFKLRGLSWIIQISKTRSSRLAVLLRLNEDNGSEKNEITMSMKLVSSNVNVHPIEKYITKQYVYLQDINKQFALWDDLVKPENGFIINNSIMLEIKLFSGKIEGAAYPKNDIKLLHMECAICLECIDSQKISVTPCSHVFCTECVTKVISDRGVCPSCSTAVQLTAIRPLYLPM